MSRHNELLSIGEMSKLTGVSIKSLRYYERIDILKPAYINSDTGYRYYSLDQIYLVEIIIFCIELGIPLKEFSNHVDEDSVMDFRKFFALGKEITQKKLKSLERGLKLIDAIEQQMDLAELHQDGKIYTREILEKIFYTKPCEKPPKDITQIEIASLFMNTTYFEDAYNIYDELSEYGFLCEYSQKGIQYHAFIEIPKNMEVEDTIIVPSGTYFCKLDERSQMEQAPKIFEKYLATKDSFIAIETEIVTGKYRINKPVNELRVISLPFSK